MNKHIPEMEHMLVKRRREVDPGWLEDRENRIASLTAKADEEKAKPKGRAKRSYKLPRQWRQVQAIAVVIGFHNFKQAAKHFGMPASLIKHAVETGAQVSGLWFQEVRAGRAVHVPLKFSSRDIPVFRDDGQFYTSITAAAGISFAGENRVSGHKYNRRHRRWMQLKRCIKRGLPFEGHVYRLATKTDAAWAKKGAVQGG